MLFISKQDKRQREEQLCTDSESCSPGYRHHPPAVTQHTKLTFLLLFLQRPAELIVYFYVAVFMACEYKELRRGLAAILPNGQQNQPVATVLPGHGESVIVSWSSSDRDLGCVREDFCALKDAISLSY